MLPDPGKAQANRFNLARRLSYAVIPYPRDRCPDQRGGTLAAQADTGCHDAGGRARLDQAYGQTILSNYEDYDKLKKRIENGVAPTEAMDLSALFFLLFNSGVKTADGVCLKTCHRAAPVEDEYEFCYIVLHKKKPPFVFVP